MNAGLGVWVGLRYNCWCMSREIIKRFGPHREEDESGTTWKDIVATGHHWKLEGAKRLLLGNSLAIVTSEG